MFSAHDRSTEQYYPQGMPQLVLQATADHVRRIASDSNPAQALIELIWNSIDAEADNVTVSYERDNFLGAITQVIVSDTGHGISSDEVSTEFGRLGDSWKRRGNRRSKNGKRQLRGSKGQGRLRAFALGSQIQWVSTSVNMERSLMTIRIEGLASTRNVFSWDIVPTPEDPKVGTAFRAFNSQKPSLNSLDTTTSQELIASAFAPVLLDDPDITITIDGTTLDPKNQIHFDTTYDQDVEVEGDTTIALKVRIIEWRQGKHRQIYYGEAPGRATHVEDGQSIENQYAYSAYISWSQLEVNSDLIALGGIAPEPVNQLILTARATVIKHFRRSAAHQFTGA
jgi:Histidine kinase-, DNA gyrase B-, and HSP90-like ATPase